MRDIRDYTEKYLKPNFESVQLVYRRKKILEILEKYPHKRMLEIGCGMEPLCLYVDDYEDYVIVEPSNIFYENALKQVNKGVLCRNECFMYHDELKKMEFDFIVCSSLLHELENPNEMLKDIWNVSGENTIIHINVPNANSFHRILAVESGIIKATNSFSERNIIYQQHNVFSIEELKRLVDKNGFEVLDEGSYFIKPFTHEQMEKCQKNHIITDNVLDGLYNMEKYLPGLGSEIYINIKRK